MSRVLTLGQFARTSVGKKTLVAISGLALSGFTLMHMSANMVLLFSAEAYNKYSHGLVTNPLIYLAEAGLLGFFLMHVGLAVSLYFENRGARKMSYLSTAKQKRAAFASSSMIYSGLVLLVFLVLHLITFKFGQYYPVEYDGIEMRDLHRLVMEKFQSPLYSGWYIFSLIILGFHLSHGISASLQSLGAFSRLDPRVKTIGMVVAIIISAGFISQPVFAILRGVN